METKNKLVYYFFGSIVSLVIIWLLVSLYLASQATNLVFNNKVSWTSVPSVADLNYKLDWQKNKNGKTFSIWSFENPSSDKYIIYYHGNAGRLLHFFPELISDYNIISPAYNGYSESEGDPSVDATYDVAIKTYDWLVAKGVSEDKITIFGHSMGGSPATYVASQRPKASKLVVVNTFSSIMSMCTKQYGPLCIFTGSVFNSVEHAKSVTIPVYVFAYIGDTTVPFGEGKKLFEAFKSQNKTFIELDGNTHSYPKFDVILNNIKN
jgi:uncharacterized protein